MAVGNMYKCTVSVTGVAGSPYYISGYFDRDGGTAQQASDAWYAFVTFTGNASSLKAGATYSTGSEVQIVSTTTAQAVAFETITPKTDTGTGVFDVLPHANQFLIRWRTDDVIAGRRIRGRTSIPLPKVSDQDPNGSVLPAKVTSLNSNAAALVNSTNAQLVVFSKLNGEWSAVVNGSAWTEFSVLRSRRD